jgi:DNA-binding PadR family transcriptional regulator
VGITVERASLGELEQIVLAVAFRLKEGYGAELLREIELRTGRQIHGGALYVVLDRLEAKGLIRSRMGDPESRRGGRPKRFIRVTPQGATALVDHRMTMLRVWEGMESSLDER